MINVLACVDHSLSVFEDTLEGGLLVELSRGIMLLLPDHLPEEGQELPLRGGGQLVSLEVLGVVPLADLDVVNSHDLLQSGEILAVEVGDQGV